MEVARYGRLRLGRCVTHDYGFLGRKSSLIVIIIVVIIVITLV